MNVHEYQAKELLRGFKRIRPGIHLKCFTAVEIAFFAEFNGRFHFNVGYMF